MISHWAFALRNQTDSIIGANSERRDIRYVDGRKCIFDLVEPAIWREDRDITIEATPRAIHVVKERVRVKFVIIRASLCFERII